jgi:hypothetical protein
MNEPRAPRSGMTLLGAVVCCFATVCVCVTAIVITHMVLSRSGGARLEPAVPPVPAPSAPTAAAPGAQEAPRPASSVAPSPPAAPPAQPEVEGNLVRNGGFEQLGGEGASAFEHWGYWGRWEKGNYTLEAAEGRTGKRSAQMCCVKPGRGGISQRLEGCKPGDKLQITFWVKATNAVGGRLFLNLEGTPGDGWATMDLKPGTYDWREFTKVVTCPPSTASGYHIAIFFYNKTQGDVAIDDVAVVKIAP